MSKNKSLDLYYDETAELLQKIEKQLIELEKNPANNDLINEIFRSLHTIKGSGSMFGLNRIAGFTHEVETLFDLIRKNIISVNKDIINLTLRAKDHIEFLLKNRDSELPVTSEENELLKAFRAINPEKKADNIKDINKAEKYDTAKNNKEIYKVNIKPDKDIMLRGVNLCLLINELCSLGESIVIPYYKEIPDFDLINPELCYISWTVVLTTDKTINDIKDVFIFVEDYCKISIEKIYYKQVSEEIDYKKIGEILLDNNEITKEQVNDILNQSKRFGSIAVEKGFVKEEVIEAVLNEQNEIRKVIKKKKEQEESATIRVKYKKLDDLVNYIGELVTLQAQISQYSNNNKDQAFHVLSENLDRLTSELRDHSMELRMIPIEETFSGIHRIVRDLSKSLGKEVNLITNGGETELDKTVIDELKDPLIHIVRNSIDHGVELPDIRKSKGKKETGEVVISVYSEGANVVIKITDDGAGLDREKILTKALENKLIKNTDLTEKEIFNLIFLPGFSTSDKATEISGRGVGMDIVKRNVESLRGNIDVESTANTGTVIILKIPLTLAIIDGLLLNIQNEKYILNLSLISECIDLTPDLIQKAGDKNVINLRGEIVPYILLRELFNIKGEKPDIQQLVILNIDNQKVGLVVDDIIGQHKVVLKSTGKIFNKMDEISGATILGDGTIALVLDAVKIYKKEIKF